MPDSPEEETLLSLPEVLDLIEERRGKRITASTFRSYVARDQAPKPVRYQGREPLFSPSAVGQWLDERPGRGTRTDLRGRSTDLGVKHS